MYHLIHGEYIHKYNPVYVTKPTPNNPPKKTTDAVHLRIQWYIHNFEKAFKF